MISNDDEWRFFLYEENAPLEASESYIFRICGSRFAHHVIRIGRACDMLDMRL